jgi:hypothetical protein
VAAEMAAMAPGTVQLNLFFAWKKKLTKYVKDGETSEYQWSFSNKCNGKV